MQGFPGGAVVESPPADVGDMGSCPGLGRSHIAAERLGPWAMAAEPARPEPVLLNGRGHDSERPAYHQKKKKIITEKYITLKVQLQIVLLDTSNLSLSSSGTFVICLNSMNHL